MMKRMAAPKNHTCRLKSLVKRSLSASRLSCTLRCVCRPLMRSNFSRVSSSMCCCSALKRLQHRKAK